MIREMMQNDICDVMTIWLEANIKTHDFIASDYWKRNYTDVEQMLPEAEVYVYKKNIRAMAFYKREGFLIIKELMEKENKEPEYEMRWNGDKMYNILENR